MDNPNKIYEEQMAAGMTVEDIVGAVHQARVRFDLSDVKTHAIKNMHPGQAAVLAVRDALGHYELPAPPKLRYTSMKRKTGQGGHRIEDGVIWVEATLRSRSGAQHTASVPCLVHDGQILDPEIMVHNGRVRVIAQSAFDDITGNAEIWDRRPDRKNMFSPPPNRHESKPRAEPRVNEGLYGRVAAGETNPWAVCTESVGREDEEKYERCVKDVKEGRVFTAGCACKLKRDVMCKGRGGATWMYSAGTKCTVIRDMAGDGSMYYVDFGPGQGRAPVSGEDLAL